MKLFKKAIFLFLAILPMLPFVLFAVSSIGNDSAEQVQISPTNVFITDGFVAYDVAEGHESIITKYAQTIIPPHNQADYYGEGTLMYSLVGLLANLQGALSNHVIFTDYHVIALGVTIYYFFVALLMSLADIVTFIPRKCGEIFGG